MKTKKQVISDRPEYKALINAVVRQSGGTDHFEEIARHGVYAGWRGFCYYSDTVPFGRRHSATLARLAGEYADDCGESGGAVGLVSGFRCLKDGDCSPDEIGRCLYGKGKGNSEDANTIIFNALAWFALE